MTEPVQAEELEKARSFAKGRFVLASRFRTRRSCSASPRAPRGCRGRAGEVLAGLDAVTVEDVQRVAVDILGEDLRLALIGPFDDPDAVREAARGLNPLRGRRARSRLGADVPVVAGVAILCAMLHSRPPGDEAE